MSIKNKLISIFCIFIWISSFNTINAYGIVTPEVKGKCAILMERTTGKVIFEKNSNLRAFPASTTKILTAIIMLQYIDLEEIIVIGEEINSIPSDSSKAGHKVGESISGINILRGLMLPSGNESGCVVAQVVAERTTGRSDIPYSEAEAIFADIMNETAKNLGAENSHFVNPHGYHNELHYTTAMDMALICKEALSIPAFSEVTSEVFYMGESVTENKTPSMFINAYDWRTTNNLIKPDSPYYYPYAKGIKTGYTGPAGYCLASSADNDELELISIVFHSEENLRYEDSIILYDFGFNNFSFNQVQKANTIVDNVAFHNPMLGEASDMDVIAKGEFTDLFMTEDFSRLTSEIVYDVNLIYTPSQEELQATDSEQREIESEEVEPGEVEIKQNGTDEKIIIKLPVQEGDVLGYLSYTIDGEEIYRDDLLATVSANERTKESDYEYYKQQFIDFAFSKDAIPYWIGLVAIILGILFTIISLIRRRIERGRRYRVNYKHRRY